ncbi:MAG: glycine cleavage system aminomethyltransferase GcvT [Deltaproteobacteria bacterium]|nr:glycine cleavage system aminomethyltransferase GcvT [Deltaproteobacteria bacterium]MBK8717823.1 glycine cleavage system aminomethyltransferase GcvT [Deltaproteobacteria bacterium]MBP7287815.1 glycine cleavage system aminomethyltransferase GcvT [Nannocystaceae bacterium]
MAESTARTPLFDAHVALGAKMVDFAGWSMPIQYPAGILAEHRAVREHAGIFDVSHMGEVDFRGAGAIACVQRLVTNDIGKLVDGRAMYTVTCNPEGGIVDDCIVYRLAADHLRIVVNAANVAKDFAHFRRFGEGADCSIDDVSSSWALLAVQGPAAVGIVAGLAGAELAEVPSFGLGQGRIAGVAVLAARTGYTGEDGFELFVAPDGARAVWDAIVGAGVQPIGLGARDTLRLEARLSLYGNDIDETTEPFGAGLGWVVKLDKGIACVGHDALVEFKRNGSAQKLVGFRVTDRAIVREGAEVVDDTDAVIGRVSSGGVAPTVGGAVGMAWVPAAVAGADAPLRLRQRGRIALAQQVKGPFYRRKPA